MRQLMIHFQDRYEEKWTPASQEVAQLIDRKMIQENFPWFVTHQNLLMNLEQELINNFFDQWSNTTENTTYAKDMPISTQAFQNTFIWI